MFDADELNPEQRTAATHGEGPLLIVAGAGTGKTTTLAARVAWLVAERAVAPGNRSANSRMLRTVAARNP